MNELYVISISGLYMTRQFIWMLLTLLTPVICNAQNTSSKNVYKYLDTISVYYPSITFDTANDGSNRYYVNDIRVDKKTSDIYQENGRLIDKCKTMCFKSI